MKEHMEAMGEVTSRGAEKKTFSEIHGSSRRSLGCAVEGVYEAQVGSSANKFVMREPAGVRQLFQSIGCLEIG